MTAAKEFFNNPVRLYADRRLSPAFPAYTIGSLREAIAAGADALSFDLGITKGGELVAGNGDEGMAGPSLEDCLTSFPGVKFMLHLKGVTPVFVQKLCDCLVRNDAVPCVIIGMPDAGCMDILRRRIPECATVCTPMETLGAILLSKTGLIFAKKRFAGDLILVPEFASGVRLIVPSFVKEMHSRGVKVCALFPDGEKAVKRLAEAGADSFLADDVAAVKMTKCNRRF